MPGGEEMTLVSQDCRHVGAPRSGEPGVYFAPGAFDLACWVVLAACVCSALAMPALAQAAENPIPASGGALILDKALPDPLAAGWKGGKTCEMLRENGSMRALRCVFPPGHGHEKHVHAAHFGYVEKGGRMRLTDAKGVREVDLDDGDSWWSDEVDWHEAVNIGETTAIYVIVEPKQADK